MTGKRDNDGTGRPQPARTFLRDFEPLGRLRLDRALLAGLRALEGSEAYLVGGALRDLALSAPVAQDYDFVLKGDAAAAARAAAEGLGGSSFALDEAAGCHRAVAKGAGKATLDFSRMGEGGIVEDLGRRDFTVNAMAVEAGALLKGEGRLIDPFGGLEDASAALLREVAPSAFDDDPVRMLRAVRLSSRYGLVIAPDTLGRMSEKADLIAGASIERVREELSELFLSGGAAGGLRLMCSTGLAERVLPEISGWGSVDGYDLLSHSLATLEEAEALLAGLSEETFPGFSASLKEYFGRQEAQLPNRGIFTLAAFFHDSGKPEAISRQGGRLRFLGHDAAGAPKVRAMLERLRFSNRAAAQVSFMARNHHRAFMLAALERRSLRARGHFFRASGGEGGLMLLCLALADARATRGGQDPALYSVVLEMMDYYYGSYQRRRPRPLLTGRQIMDAFGLEEGPMVGRIIAEINDGVEKGLIRTRKEALAHIGGWLRDRGY